MIIGMKKWRKSYGMKGENKIIMDKLEMVAALVERIREEEIKKKRYLEILKEADRADSWEQSVAIWKKEWGNNPRPSNKQIKDSCKFARQLLLEISKESKAVR